MTQGASRGLAKNPKKATQHHHRKPQLTKGRKHYGVKNVTGAVRDDQATTKSIDKKNLGVVAAKAVALGTKFFLTDITSEGTKKLHQLTKDRNKRQQGSKVSDRVKDQLKKLEKEGKL
jgi:hypothetical protein